MLKATHINVILVNILKQNADIFSDNICNIFSFSVNEGKFPNIFKQAYITPAFEKGPRRAIVLWVFDLSLLKYFKNL